MENAVKIRVRCLNTPTAGGGYLKAIVLLSFRKMTQKLLIMGKKKQLWRDFDLQEDTEDN